MGNMKYAMANLMQGIAASARERHVAAGDCKVQTAQLLQAFGMERAATGKILTAAAAAGRKERSADASANRASVRAMRKERRQSHVRMWRGLSQRLTRSTTAVEAWVASLREEVAQTRTAASNAHLQMARAQRKKLATDRGDRARYAATLIGKFHKSRFAMAHAVARNLANLTGERRSLIAGFRQGVASSLQQGRGPGQPVGRAPAAGRGGAAHVPAYAAIHEADAPKKR